MDEFPDFGAMQATAEELAGEWGLDLGSPFALARFSYVAPVGDEAVLKVAWAGDDESLEEGEALQLWAGDGAVRFLRGDKTRRAVLEERAVPGTDISELPEDEAVAIAVDVGTKLWRPARPPFRRVADEVPRWIENAEREPDSIGWLLELAREVWSSFQPGDDWIVHGDFHHHNILRHGDRHVAIDPKPYAADREYDVPSFLWNPMTQRLTDVERTERRIAAFVAAGLDDHKIRVWTLIRGSYLRGDEEQGSVMRALLGL
jgi:streptomycin 6-kinase